MLIERKMRAINSDEILIVFSADELRTITNCINVAANFLAADFLSAVGTSVEEARVLQKALLQVLDRFDPPPNDECR